MIMDAQGARYEWLKIRNADMISECEWRIKQLIEAAKESKMEPDHIAYTENFEVSFNDVSEPIKLKEYLNKLGYVVEMEFSGDVDKKDFRWNIRIGL